MNYNYGTQAYPNMGMPFYNQPNTYMPYSNYGNNSITNQAIQSTSQNEPTIQLCDSADYVRSQNTRLDGQPSFYALTDGSEIYCKKLNPVNGTGVVLKYTLVNSEDTTKPENNLNSAITQLQSDVAELKMLLLDSITTPSKGGDKK